MTRKHRPSQCPLCGGTKKSGATTFTAELKFGIVVVRSVPVLRCSMCGADWIQDDIAARLEVIVNEAQQDGCKWKSLPSPKACVRDPPSDLTLSITRTIRHHPSIFLLSVIPHSCNQESLSTID